MLVFHIGPPLQHADPWKMDTFILVHSRSPNQAAQYETRIKAGKDALCAEAGISEDATVGFGSLMHA